MSNRMNFWTTSGDWIDISPYCTDFSTTDQLVSVHIFTRNKSHVDGEVYLIPSLQITRQSYQKNIYLKKCGRTEMRFSEVRNVFTTCSKPRIHIKCYLFVCNNVLWSNNSVFSTSLTQLILFHIYKYHNRNGQYLKSADLEIQVKNSNYEIRINDPSYLNQTDHGLRIHHNLLQVTYQDQPRTFVPTNK